MSTVAFKEILHGSLKGAISSGLSYGIGSTKDTSSIRCTIISTILASAYVENALDLVKKTFSLWKTPPYFWTFRFALCITPFALALFKIKKESLPKGAQAIVDTAQKGLETLCDVAILVSALTLSYFGSALYAIPIVLLMGTNVLCKASWIPKPVADKFYTGLSYPLISYGLISGLRSNNYFAKFFSALTIAVLGKCYYSENKDTDSYKLPENRLTIDAIIRQNTYNPPDLRFNKNYIRSDARSSLLSRIPDIDTSKTLLEIFDSVPENSPDSRQKLENTLKAIAEKLKRCDDVDKKKNILSRLSIEEKSHEEILQSAKTILEELLEEGEELPTFTLKEKILFFLQESRKTHLLDFYKNFKENGDPPARLAFQSIGAPSEEEWISLIGPLFGVKTSSTQKDSLFQRADLLMRRCGLIPIMETIWNHYKPYDEVLFLSKKTEGDLPPFSIEEIKAFWRGWIKREDTLNGDDKALQSLEENGSFLVSEEKEIEVVRSVFNREYITKQAMQYMLLDMGILEESSSNPSY